MTRIDPQHRLFLQWLVFAGVLIFAVWLSWEYGLLVRVYANDPTRLSLLITVLFIASSGHCALRAYYLSSQLNRVSQLHVAAANAATVELALDGDSVMLNGLPLPRSLTRDYLGSVLKKRSLSGADRDGPADNTQLTDVLAEQAHGQHEMGWFLTGLMIKLGLLGTVIGFVLMLGSISNMESFDIADVQNVLRRMTVGMGVALNTTLVGLLGSMLLGFQYLLLDRGADKIVADTVHFTEIYLRGPRTGGE